MAQLEKRQQNILVFIGSKGTARNQEILAHLQKTGESFSRKTLVRELKALVDKGLIEKTGKGRSVAYHLKTPILAPVDADVYLAQDVDMRSPKPIHFDFSVFEKTDSLFSDAEISEVSNANEDYRTRVAKLSPILLQKEFERITIELSWKSSKIEGNTYTLLDTEALIKEHREAEGHNTK